jgi:DNA-binding transcriptional LysR family regulator
MENWLGVEIRHLATLAAIDEERSFRGAAERLGYVQSAVSQQICQLERLVGVRLVDRARGQTRAELTEAGQLLLRHAERTLGRLRAAQTDLEALARSSRGGKLHVGAFQSVSTSIMPLVLARLATERPGLEVTVTEARSDESLFAAVESGELDTAFAELPLAPGPFEATKVMEDSCVLLVQAGSPLAQAATPPTLAEIAELPLVGHTSWRMPELIERQLRASGLEPRYVVSLDGNTAVQALVAAGLGAAILPRLSVDDSDPGVALLDLDAILPPRTLVVYRHRERIAQQAAFDAFAAAVRAECARLTAARQHARDERREGADALPTRFRHSGWTALAGTLS